MNTRVSPGPKHEPPVEVSYAPQSLGLYNPNITPWGRQPTGNSRDTPFPVIRGIGDWPDHRDKLQLRARIGARLAGIAAWPALGFGLLIGAAAILGWRSGAFVTGGGTVVDGLLFAFVGSLALAMIGGATWLILQQFRLVPGSQPSLRRILLVFGTESFKATEDRVLEPGVHVFEADRAEHIPWTHVAGPMLSRHAMYIICIGRRVVMIPLIAKGIDLRAGELISVAAKVERAVRGNASERESLESLVALAGPKCPKCSYSLRGVKAKCPECGLYVVNAFNRDGQIFGNDFSLQQLWDTDMPA
jgi:hypothetical protein